MARVVMFGKNSQGDLGSQGGLVKKDELWTYLIFATGGAHVNSF